MKNKFYKALILFSIISISLASCTGSKYGGEPRKGHGIDNRKYKGY